ncbi:hypothetical protein BDV12DRAFT_165141 [Aspergillus spectabilis]
MNGSRREAERRGLLTKKSLVLSSTRIPGHHVIGLQQTQNDRQLLPISGSIKKRSMGSYHLEFLPLSRRLLLRGLSIPASEVSVERLFNAGRDILGVRRHSMKGEIMRILNFLCC